MSECSCVHGPQPARRTAVRNTGAVVERKPQGMPWESWVERRLREARDRGAFEDLAGLGKPLEIHDAMTWVRDKARQEGLPITALLPPSLAVAKEVEDLPFKLAGERSEARVRALLTDLNRRIDAARRGPQIGPPVRTPLLDVEEQVAAWRAALQQSPRRVPEVGDPRPAPDSQTRHSTSPRTAPRAGGSPTPA